MQEKIEVKSDVVLVSIPASWFAQFTIFLATIPVAYVKPEHIIAVHRVWQCFEESYEEVYGEQLDLFKIGRE